MKLIATIRNYKRDKILRRHVVMPHTKCIKNLDDIRTIGLVAHNPSPDELTVIRQFIQAMSSRNCLVRKLIFPADTTNMLDRYGLPLESAVGDFYDHHYDILIDATPENDILGLAVVLRTKTHLRIAYDDTQMMPNPTKNEAYDFIIRGNGPMNLQYFLTDILTYLTKIKK